MATLRIYQDSRGMGRCRSCDQPVEWAQFTSGKRMPFDPPIIVTRTVEGERIVEEVDSLVTKSHFATCPDSKTWRKAKR